MVNIVDSNAATLLLGSPDLDTIFGLGGADTVFGFSGGDALFGNQDADVLLGSLGNDTVLGGQGSDTIRGGQGNDVLEGGLGDDLIFGDIGADTITGGLGSDTIAIGVSDNPSVAPTTGGPAFLDSDLLVDFNGSEDRLQILGDRRFADLEIGVLDGQTYVRDLVTGDYLARFSGEVALTADSFVGLNAAPNPPAPPVVVDPPAAPEIELSEPYTGNLLSGSTILNFGTALGGETRTKNLTIYNIGNAPLALGAPLLPKYFALSSFPTLLAPQAQADFTLSFAPPSGADGAFQVASLQIPSNDSDENPFNLLTGAIVSSPTPPPIPAPAPEPEPEHEHGPVPA